MKSISGHTLYAIAMSVYIIAAMAAYLSYELGDANFNDVVVHIMYNTFLTVWLSLFILTKRKL